MNEPVTPFVPDPEEMDRAMESLGTMPESELFSLFASIFNRILEEKGKPETSTDSESTSTEQVKKEMQGNG